MLEEILPPPPNPGQFIISSPFFKWHIRTKLYTAHSNSAKLNSIKISETEVQLWLIWCYIGREVTTREPAGGGSVFSKDFIKQPLNYAGISWLGKISKNYKRTGL